MTEAVTNNPVNDLRVIQGGGGQPEPRYFVMEMDQTCGGFVILTRGFMEVVCDNEEDDTSPKKLVRVDNLVGSPVDNRELADAFCAAMNERWDRDLANEPEISDQDWWKGLKI